MQKALFIYISFFELVITIMHIKNKKDEHLCSPLV